MLEWVGKDALQPIGVSPNSRTVWLIISSGSEVMSVERMNHCLPAVEEIRTTTLDWGANGCKDFTDLSPSKPGRHYPVGLKMPSRSPRSTNSSPRPS